MISWSAVRISVTVETPLLEVVSCGSLCFRFYLIGFILADGFLAGVMRSKYFNFSFRIILLINFSAICFWENNLSSKWHI